MLIAGAMSSAKKSKKLTAKNADIHVLYQNSVQDPPNDIEFMVDTFKKERGREPLVVREDFCGTALLCADWVKNQPKRTAIGLDLHAPTLQWAREHNISPLGADAERVTLLEADVMRDIEQKADITCAFNFSYCIFKSRRELIAYFEAARRSLKDGGAFMLDIHGGSENTVEVEEETEHDDFTYVWDQTPYDAITGHSIRHIHFRFPDGSEITNAFTYDWRLWTLPEVRDVLMDAGFAKVEVFWEGTDEDGEGNGEFTKTATAEQEESWVAYVVAWR